MYRDILTRNSFLNAIAIVNVLGGSTNAVRRMFLLASACVTNVLGMKVLHLLAMARAADIELSIDDFQTVADKTPYLADLMYVQTYHRRFFSTQNTLLLLLGHLADTTWKMFIELEEFQQL